MLKEKRIAQIRSQKRERLYTKTVYVYECDHCYVEFDRKQRDKRPMHFCSRKCYQASMRSGKAHDYVVSQMTDEVIEKIRQTMLTCYGVSTTLNLPGVQEKIRDVCRLKFGGNSSMADPEVRMKKEQTFLKRYGTTVPIVHCENVVSKSVVTQIERYGDIFTRTQAYKDAFKATSLKHWGVQHPMQSSDVKSKIDFRASWHKQHETKKRNGTYAVSKIERRFGDLLVSMFGDHDVECQVIVNNWSIDFYVKSIDTYVQFDGVYWHGLDRPINVIQNSSTLRDKRIFESYANDRLQENWFTEHHMRLIRVTDREFKQDSTGTLQKVKVTQS